MKALILVRVSHYQPRLAPSRRSAPAPQRDVSGQQRRISAAKTVEMGLCWPDALSGAERLGLYPVSVAYSTAGFKPHTAHYAHRRWSRRAARDSHAATPRHVAPRCATPPTAAQTQPRVRFSK